jgi:hypothetical protein
MQKRQLFERFVVGLLVGIGAGLAPAQGINNQKERQQDTDRAAACAPLLGNQQRARKIAALLAVRELAQKKGGVSIEGQETIVGNDYKISVYEDGVQIIKPVTETYTGSPASRPGEYCVEVAEVQR